MPCSPHYSYIECGMNALRTTKCLKNLARYSLELPPVAIKDHRGKTVSTEYAFVHPTRVVDCIDQKLPSENGFFSALRIGCRGLARCALAQPAGRKT